MKTIIIIEDDPVVAKVYGARLERDGYNVLVASDGQEGFYLVHGQKPDAVILDLMLPKMDGLQLLRKFRAQKDYENLPVLVFTNEFASEMTREAKAAGATDVFDKNKITPEDMVKALARVFFPAKPATVSELKDNPAATSTRLASSLSKTEPESHDMAKAFLSSGPATVNRLREILVRIIRAKDVAQQIAGLSELLQATHLVSGAATAADQKTIARSGAALEAYLCDLISRPQEITASAIRTICQAIDFISLLLKQPIEIAAFHEPGLVLIVDDEPLSRRAARTAMDRAQMKSICLSYPTTALQVLEENPFDLIILDVQMPEMDGLTLCQNLREIPAHKTTPVIFATSMTDFETRLKTAASGGNEFIAKPYVLMELALKALISLNRPKPSGN